MRWLARLGGFQDRAGDDAPGLKVLWRGLRRLVDITFGYQLATTASAFPVATGLLGNG